MQVYLISYDISENKKRTKLHKILLREECIRLQYSVYMIECKKKKIIDLSNKISIFVNQKKGESLYIFKVDKKFDQLYHDNNKMKYYLSEEIEYIEI